MYPGETIMGGATPICTDCDALADWHVRLTPAGYSVGTSCHCGPYSRETRYFDTELEAECVLRVFIESGVLPYARG